MSNRIIPPSPTGDTWVRSPAGDDPTRPLATGRGWRIVDIVVAAVLGVATGVIFWVWNTPGNALFTAADGLLPGVAGIANGLWLLGGPLGGLVIRRPGAAILVETLAAIVSAVAGNQWGWSTVWIGLAQGLGAELAFALFLYRRGNLGVALLSGALSGVACWAYSFATGGLTRTASYNLVYLATTVVSAMVTAVLAWLLTGGLAAAGALNRFPSGRRELV